MSILECDQLSYYDRRQLHRDPKDSTAPELFLTTANQMDDYFNMRCLYQDHITSLLVEPVYQDIETYLVHDELQNCDDPWDVSNLMPRGMTLKNALKIDQMNTKSWTQPCLDNNRKRKAFTINEVSVTDYRRFDFERIMKANDHIQQDARNLILNSTALPFSVETIRVPTKVYRELSKDHPAETVIEFEYDPSDPDYVNVASRLIVGYGRNAAVAIGFGFTEVDFDANNSDIRKYVFKYSALPEDISKFLRKLPPMYSVNAKSQIRSLNAVLTDLYNIYMKFSVFELGSLAIATGCIMNDYSLFAFSAIMHNKPFPVGIDSMDQKWARNWDELPSSMKQYVRDKFQLMYDSYVTLSGLLLRNIFPDPDITLTVTELSQPAFVSWFLHFVALALSEANLTNPTSQTSTRFDMILELGPDTGLLGVLADLIIKTPAANFGGARYLHHARYQFLVRQYYTLCNIKLYKYPGESPNTSKNLDNDRYLLMYNREYVNDSGKPAFAVGLLPSPQFVKSVFSFDPEIDDVISFEDYNGRNLAADLKEWGRLNVEKIPDLFNMLRELSVEDLGKFWISKIGTYTHLSNTYFNVMNVRIVVPDLERSLKMRKERIEEEYKSSASKLLLKAQEHRLNIVHHASVSQSNKVRVALHQYAHNIIPGNSTNKNRRKARQKKVRIDKLKLRFGDKFVDPSVRRRRRLLNELKSQGTEERWLDSNDLRYKIEH